MSGLELVAQVYEGVHPPEGFQVENDKMYAMFDRIVIADAHFTLYWGDKEVATSPLSGRLMSGDMVEITGLEGRMEVKFA